LRATLGPKRAPYMVPDTVQVLDALPRTTTSKIDYQALRLR
jgi:acyl-coenzyme A synthetase/AMP-(fatty) acid ligase